MERNTKYSAIRRQATVKTQSKSKMKTKKKKYYVGITTQSQSLTQKKNVAQNAVIKLKRCYKLRNYRLKVIGTVQRSMDFWVTLHFLEDREVNKADLLGGCYLQR